MRRFDLIVLGGGSGGLATAQRAAEYGARVALFEPRRLGGTCVNVGCVPKKIMWYAAELAGGIERARDYGFDVRADGHDWAHLKSGRDAYVRRLNGIYQRNLDRKAITTIRAAGRFSGPRALVDANGDAYAAEHVVIATGGYPVVPSLPGAALGITSDGFFELERRPRRVAIVGSGYVAVELGGVFNALGTETVLFVRGERLLRGFDSLLAEQLAKQMRAGGVEIVTHGLPRAVRGTAGDITLEMPDGRSYSGFETLLWAIGRVPHTASLGLERAGVEIDAAAAVVVDAFQNTSAERTYAIGDVTGRALLTPVAIAAGRRLADRVFGGQADRRLSYDLLPTVVFSHPPIGTVGLSETAARERFAGETIKVYQTEFVPMYYALGNVKPQTAMKLVTVGADEKIVGCHVIGPGADEMIQGFAVALTMGARKRDFDDTLAIHPTSAEEMVTMR
ncbi:MAG TPA: glutathione-disulfide reductase [Gammaproteobacteria bacterium]|nr:glutathione-disulfide reductase [Gammaproteobacteria bacterium]